MNTFRSNIQTDVQLIEMYSMSKHKTDKILDIMKELHYFTNSSPEETE